MKNDKSIKIVLDKKMIVDIYNNSNNKLPEYAHVGDSGVDLYAAESIVIPSHTQMLVKTGLYVAIPEGFEIQIRSRSGLALKSGVFVLNSPGTIDSGYRNEIGVILFNMSNVIFYVDVGMRIAQAVLCPICNISWNQVATKEELGTTNRNLGGFGSSGM